MANRDQFLFDIVVTACEGGVNYWAWVTEYDWNDDDSPAIASAVLIDNEDNKKHPLNFQVVEAGIKRICSPGFQIREDILKNILLSDHSNGDQGDIDGEIADCIVQAGLFGDVIYG